MDAHTVVGYSFQWTKLHMSSEEMETMRDQYDELGSRTVTQLQKIAQEKKKGIDNATGNVPFHLDFYGLLKDHHEQDPVLEQFWTEVHDVPPWVDWAQIQRGQRFFYRYALANIMGFALQGFMGDNAAAPGTAEVLVRTGGFSTKLLFRRLLENFQLLLQVTHSLEMLQPGGEGHLTAIRVRLLHSAVRERILKISKTRPNYFDTQAYGVPANLLDSVHAIATFSCNHFWLQLPKMGIRVTQQECADYIAVWRYVGYILGVPGEYFNSVERSKAIMESMLYHEFRVTDTSKSLGHNFIQCLVDLPPVNISKEFIEAGSRVINGDRICDQLELGSPGYIAYASFRGYCWLVQLLNLLQSLHKGIDERFTDYFRMTLYDLVITNNAALAGGHNFEFKYLPIPGKLIGREDNDRQPPHSHFARPVETVLLLIFIVGCLALATVLTTGLAIVGFWARRYWVT